MTRRTKKVLTAMTNQKLYLQVDCTAIRHGPHFDGTDCARILGDDGAIQGNSGAIQYYSVQTGLHQGMGASMDLAMLTFIISYDSMFST